MYFPGSSTQYCAREGYEALALLEKEGFDF
jgi:hypothetical protein